MALATPDRSRIARGLPFLLVAVLLAALVALLGVAMVVSVTARPAGAATGDTWTLQDTTGTDGAYYGIAYGDAGFVAAGCTSGVANKFVRSATGVSWTRATSDNDGCYSGIAAGNGRYVAISQYDHKVSTSSDATTWTSSCPGTGNCNDGAEWDAINYGGGKFVAVSFYPNSDELAATSTALSVPPTLTVGQSLTIAAGGFIPGEHVQVIMHSEPLLLAEVVADQSGTATATVTVPAATGTHQLFMFGLTSRAGARAATEVLAADSLAFTRASSAAVAFWSVVLVCFGVVLVGLGLRSPARRRRH
jgi:hypothetical protein